MRIHTTPLDGRERLLWSALTLGILAAIVGGVAYSAFSVTTANPGNEFATGTVVLGDNDSDSPMYQVADALPGRTAERCITVAYTGSLDAAVRLHGSPIGPLGDHLALTITVGSLPDETAFSSCEGFVDAGPGSLLYDSTLKAFTDFATSFETGLPVGLPGQERWQTGDSVVFRFHLTLGADAPQGATTGRHDFTWTARS
jgi:hypothetical protein